MIVRGRIRTEGQSDAFPRHGADRRGWCPGSTRRKFLFHIDFEHAVEILRHVYDDRRVAALSGQTGPAATTGDRRAACPGDGNGRDHILDASRQHHADRCLPIVRSIGGVKRPATVVETHFATQIRLQLCLEVNSIDIALPDAFLFSLDF